MGIAPTLDSRLEGSMKQSLNTLNTWEWNTSCYHRKDNQISECFKNQVRQGNWKKAKCPCREGTESVCNPVTSVLLCQSLYINWIRADKVPVLSITPCCFAPYKGPLSLSTQSQTHCSVQPRPVFWTSGSHTWLTSEDHSSSRFCNLQAPSSHPRTSFSCLCLGSLAAADFPECRPGAGNTNTHGMLLGVGHCSETFHGPLCCPLVNGWGSWDTEQEQLAQSHG
jgi:hypothetical protein